ncbi:TonB-dependent receptor plug domain-containing protein [Pedobacter sp. GSP4]|uniref:TonB-dependent receptor plug domain-containing protein n=1 Tax=Pedobacter sp. GSP4 TaxID=3453716 RepID=UPI003EECB48E
MKKIIVFALAMGVSLTGFAQKADTTKRVNIKIRGNALLSATQPLIVIDGNKQYSRDINSLNEIDPNAIESITVLKDSSAISLYGADGLAGAIQIKTKGATVTDALAGKNTVVMPSVKGKISGVFIRPTIQSQDSLNNGNFLINKNGIKLKNGAAEPIYILDGKETTDIKSIAPDKIESIEILKDASAQSLYGDKAINGVVIITTKKEKTPKSKN